MQLAFMKKVGAAFTGAGVALFAALPAHAAIDVSDIVTEIKGNDTAIVDIGGAVLALVGILLVIRLIRRAM